MSTTKPSSTLQQWLKELPSSKGSSPRPSVAQNVYSSPSRCIQRSRGSLNRDSSFQSDDGSICSVESMLELRKADPEEVLLGLGFGPPSNGDSAGRIPQRFLQPSKLVKNVDFQKFLSDQGENSITDQRTILCRFNSVPSYFSRTKQRIS